MPNALLWPLQIGLNDLPVIEGHILRQVFGREHPCHPGIIPAPGYSPGFAGEDNELFYDQKTMMIFGDAKQMVTEIVRILKE